MADEIIIKYSVDLTDIKKAGAEIGKVTDMTKELQTEAKEAFSGKQIDEANAKLEKFNNTVGETVTEFKNAKSELNSLTKQINSGQLEGKALDVAKRRAAELTDQIGDAREEIRRMASDTRFFDTVVEGVRGVTAAFSVAQGAAALFGDENEDLQKALLKVQAATALLTGVQELANIATKQGGIVTQGYGLAIRVVEGIQKAFAVSSATAWAAATAGLTLAITGIALLITYWDELIGKPDEYSKEYEQFQQKNYFDKLSQDIDKTKESVKGLTDEIQGQINILEASGAKRSTIIALQLQQVEAQINANVALIQSQGLLRSQGEAQLKMADEFYQEYLEALASGNKEEMERLDVIVKGYKEKGSAIIKFFDDQYKLNNQSEVLQVQLQKQITAELEAENKKRRDIYEADFKARAEMAQKKFENAEDFESQFNAFLEEQIGKEITKVEPVTIPIKYNFTPAKEDLIKIQVKDFIDKFVKEVETIMPAINAFEQFTSAIFANQTQALELEKAKQLKIAGDDAKKREKIEQDFAIRKAKIDRQQAILKKTLSTFEVVVNTAKAISSYIGGLPATAPLLALAASIGAIQLATIAAQPLPAIPQFEEGGPVPLFGGSIIGGKISGRRHSGGGVLIAAEGGEFINRRVSAAKYSEELKAANEMRLDDLIFRKYVGPALKAAQEQQQQETYDDIYLRNTLRRGQVQDNQNTNRIIAAIEKKGFMVERYG